MGTATLTIALAGNPNSGKTTIFNNITGARQHVGNYAGVTVERREGSRHYQGKNLLLVDLPGTYSLTAYSLDEIVTRNFIVEEKPDIIVNILDASNLERNLYLATQLLELERPVALALNMTDTAEKMGIRINDKVLSEKLGVPVVRTVGNRNQGTDELLAAAVGAASAEYRPFRVDYGAEVESEIEKLIVEIEGLQDNNYPKRWLAIKLLENDNAVIENVAALIGGKALLKTAEEARRQLADSFDDDAESIIADRRYRYVAGVFGEAASKSINTENFSDKIDKVLTNRILGLPIFLGLMWLLFNMVFTVGAIPQEYMENGVTWLGEWVGSNMADGQLKSLVVDGIIAGVGGVVVFLPNIVLLFLGIAILEDSGYMARAAFIMDRTMRFAGLHGKSFIPLLMGFGCGVPAIMGTRTLENPRDRMVTILVTPFMSCSARLPVYTLLIGAFFSESMAGTVLFSIYLLGIVLAAIVARVFRSTLFKGDSEPFVMELPPYHVPSLRSVLIHMWERSVLYLKKMGTIILAASIVVWFLTNYPANVEYSKNYEEMTVQAEASFNETVAKDVFAPLSSEMTIEKIEDQPALLALAEEISAINTQFDESTAELEPASAELVAMEAERDNKLQQLETENTELYPLAVRYVELQGEFDGAKEAIEHAQASEKLEKSYAGQVGHAIETITKPLGFDWRIGIALMTGLGAKEVVISTLGTIYSIGEADETSVALKDTLAADPTFDPLVAYTLMVFTLIYAPCIAAMAVVKRETNSWKWAAFTMAYSTGLAWVVSFVVYQGGRALGF